MTMIKEIIGDATLYLGDCMEYMKDCDDNSFDLAIVDPPHMELTLPKPEKWGGKNALL